MKMLFTLGRSTCYINSHFNCFFRNTFCQKVLKDEMIKSINDNTLQNVQKNKRTKVLRIAILGLSNVGKSTLINQLSNRTVCPTSCKAHTTESNSNVIYVEKDTQLILIDTPGLVTNSEANKFSLQQSFRIDPKMATNTADVVAVVQDVSNVYTRHKIENTIFNLLNKLPSTVQTVLILNKVDKLKEKRVLLEITKQLNKSWPSFQDIFMISALNNDGVNDLKQYLLDLAKEQDWQYKEDTFTDQSPEKIIEKTARAKLLDNLPHEIPYKLLCTVEHYEVRPDASITAIVCIKCRNSRTMHLIKGQRGSRIGKIARLIEEDLRNAFRTSVIIKITLQCNDKV